MAYEKEIPLTWRGIWRWLGFGELGLLWTACGLGLAIAIAWWATGIGGAASLWIALAIVVAGYLAELVFQRRHATCDCCGRSSTLDAPARRRFSALAVELRDVGWTVGDRDLCADCGDKEAGR